MGTNPWIIMKSHLKQMSHGKLLHKRINNLNVVWFDVRDYECVVCNYEIIIRVDGRKYHGRFSISRPYIKDNTISSVHLYMFMLIRFKGTKTFTNKSILDPTKDIITQLESFVGEVTIKLYELVQ